MSAPSSIDPLHEHPPSFAARLISPLVRFSRFSASGGIVLLLCATCAVILANSSWRDEYLHILHTPIGFNIGGFFIDKPIEWWINDGLMAIFFFVVGLEIKREVLVGELRNPKNAALPVIAAVGGMLVPGLIFYFFNRGEPTVRGWGIPTATDIAFALGVLALLGSRVPHGLRVFLATLAIADDIGALLVIALFYTDKLNMNALGGAGLCLGLMFTLNIMGVRRWWMYFIPGLAMWWLVYSSGVHATIAGVAAAFAIPASSRVNHSAFVAYVRKALGADSPDPAKQQALAQAIEDASNKVQTPMHTLEHALIPWVTFFIVPIFALANAGVTLSGNLATAFASHETLGVILGLLLGKPIGITLFALLAVSTKIGRLPSGVNWTMILGTATIAGIGFTMSLFIAHLAYPPDGGEPMLTALNDAKLGILTGSTLAAIAGLGVLWWGLRTEKSISVSIRG